MIFPDAVVIWLAVAGGCAFILGASRAGIMLAMPAVIRFVLLPNFAPALDQIPVEHSCHFYQSSWYSAAFHYCNP